MELKNPQTGVLIYGFRLSLTTAILTVITFAIAVLTPPLSGPFCIADCFQYPFTDIAERFPRDYYWMYPAMILMVLYLGMMVSIHQITSPEKKHLSLLSVLIATMSTLVLFVDYFLQVSVIQPSLLKGETDGISILSQFNPHGIFIVLEEIGFLFMVISFFIIAPVFSAKITPGKAIKWVSYIGLGLTILAFIAISVIHGIEREYRFEVAVISITWVELIILGFLYAKYFKKSLKKL